MDDFKKVITVEKSMHGTVLIVNYDITNTKLNQFLSACDVWGSKGEPKNFNVDGKKPIICFECSANMYEWFRLYFTQKLLHVSYGIDVEFPTPSPSPKFKIGDKVVAKYKDHSEYGIVSEVVTGGIPSVPIYIYVVDVLGLGISEIVITDEKNLEIATFSL